MYSVVHCFTGFLACEYSALSSLIAARDKIVSILPA